MEIITGINPGSFFKFLSIFLIGSCYLPLFSSASSSITQGQTLKDGETLISDGKTFELGFFSPGNSSSRYVGIRYYDISDPAIVWVANRESPVPDKTGVLTIGSDGNLVILHGNSTIIWSSKVSSLPNNSTAVLRDTGNLVLSTNGTMGSYWESFDFPTDTFLPGMRVKVNAQEGENRAFRSWKSANDPALGDYFSGVDPRAAVQLMIWNGSERRWRSGHWNKLIFIGLPDMPTRYSAGFSLTDRDDQNGSYYLSYTPWNLSDRLRFQIRWDGFEEQSIWVEEKNEWVDLMSEPNMSRGCELYNKCGNFGLCSAANDASCECMLGFERKNWGNWSDGCKRKTLLKCQSNSTSDQDGEDVFVAVKSAKVPDFADLVVTTCQPDSCQQSCLNNCSCTAYADVSVLGCMIWTTELVDVQQFSEGGNTLYIRVAHADLDFKPSIAKAYRNFYLGLGAGVGSLLLAVTWLVYKVVKKRNKIQRKKLYFKRNGGLLLEQQLSSGEVNVEKVKLFTSKELEKSTDNYNNDRIIGQGAQGVVYKGMLADGRIVAVKKSKIVDEGKLTEFINEVVILSQINHRNVVQLLGCCLETDVPVLVYEFIPNGTLSRYISEQNEEFPLTWKMRLQIATEIAGALSYLHSAAAFPIYHRDIKSTNILLDEKFRAKVADFGISRSIAIDQTHLTTAVHGTFGYLDPEYFQSSQFTDKSDVYSFGVVLVELLTGQKPICAITRRAQEEEYYRSLATKFIVSMQEDILYEILDAGVRKEAKGKEIRNYSNLALRCLDLNGRNRPTMRAVTMELEAIQMLPENNAPNAQYDVGVEYLENDSLRLRNVVSSSGDQSASYDCPSSSLLEYQQSTIKTW